MSRKTLTGWLNSMMALVSGLALLTSIACDSSSSSTEPGDRSDSQAVVPTISATVTCDPQNNTLPATIKTCVSIQNLVDSPRIVDGRIDLWLGGGAPLYEWRFQAVELSPMGSWNRCWNNELRDLQSLEDQNIARLTVVDVTPPPFNQPPYPPSGFVVEDTCFFWGIQP
jgi:hypothetical protein